MEEGEEEFNSCFIGAIQPTDHLFCGGKLVFIQSKIIRFSGNSISRINELQNDPNQPLSTNRNFEEEGGGG